GRGRGRGARGRRGRRGWRGRGGRSRLVLLALLLLGRRGLLRLLALLGDLGVARGSGRRGGHDHNRDRAGPAKQSDEQSLHPSPAASLTPVWVSVDPNIQALDVW